ncbi:MAG: lactate utilization protein [Gammaproteobacteria bacterium]|nr:lactate utilization protein [Gammaproteobacteria bacterium]
MNAKEQILSRIRKHKNHAGDPVTERSGIRLPRPDYGPGVEVGGVRQFTQMLEMVHGTWAALDTVEEVPGAVRAYLLESGGPRRIVASPDPVVESLDWAGLEIEHRRANREDEVSVTMAFAGIAETGTVAMVSSSRSPVTLNFLPEIHIVILKEPSLVPMMDDFWPLVESSPRAINFITGPSKTADIEQTIVYGAHGPKRFHVLIIRSG